MVWMVLLTSWKFWVRKKIWTWFCWFIFVAWSCRLALVCVWRLGLNLRFGSFRHAQIRFTGGRNGIGAKATNVFSQSFEAGNLWNNRPGGPLLTRYKWSYIWGPLIYGFFWWVTGVRTISGGKKPLRVTSRGARLVALETLGWKMNLLNFLPLARCELFVFGRF